MPLIVSVAVFRPLPGPFSYLCDSEIKAGAYLEVPFGRGKCQAIALEDSCEQALPKDYELKTVGRLYPDQYRLPKELLDLANWMSQYYLCAPGEALSCLAPPKPLLKHSDVSAEQSQAVAPALEATLAQNEALEAIRQTQKPSLLFGVTGSGKTEVFMRLIEDCLLSGKSALYLLPEITLTHETLRKLSLRFQPVLIFHSRMSPKERRETWLKARCSGPHLIVGARSALFSPVDHPGLIIVDEEHDSSYKQDASPRYNGRDLAVMRAKLCGAQIILGSATPSLESYHNAQKGKYQLIELTKRISPHPMPEVKVVDISKERKEQFIRGPIIISRELIKRTKIALLKKRQVIMLLNRRGFSTLIQCNACGEKLRCPHCDVSLTYYRKKNLGLCHHCAYQSKPPEACPSCALKAMSYKGAGTEKLDELVQAAFDKAHIIRVDGSQGDSEDNQKELARFIADKEGDILLGTQMISKGLDSDNIELSAALNADLGLSMPDFRASERVFQLLTQLAGRSGRGQQAGLCIIQSDQPEHYAIVHATKHDYLSFYERECSEREKFGYPPFGLLSRIVLSSIKEGLIESLARELGTPLSKLAKEHGTVFLGPNPCPLSKIKNKYRWQILIKSGGYTNMTQFLRAALKQLGKPRQIDIQLDRDPQNLM